MHKGIMNGEHMKQIYKAFLNSRFYNYFSMLVKQKNILEQANVTFLFFQTPLQQNIKNLSEFEQERLKNWKFDFNHITSKDCEIIKKIYSENIDEDYLKQLYDGAKIYTQNGVRYLADFSSKYVNIVAGKRITTEVPQNYRNRIWIYGQCTARGTGVEDSQTISSYLQKIINQKYPESFRVVNCAIGCGSDIYDDIMHMKEENIKSGDIVCLCTNLEIVPKELFVKHQVEYYDSSFLFSRPHNLGEWFTDSTFHTNMVGNKIIAEYMYRVLEKRNLFVELEEKANCNYDVNKKKDISLDEYSVELQNYIAKIRSYKINEGVKGCIVMNCNPFTKGHQFLIEYAAKKVDYLYVFIVEEDKSFFQFRERFYLVKEATKHLKNVIILPSGKFIISAVTFPGYFYKDYCKDIVIDAGMDLKIFGKFIAPELGITVRFAGNEPTDFITKQYNEAMMEQLPSYGIKFVEVKRKEQENIVISASTVRQYLKEGKLEEIKSLVPEITFNYLQRKVKND